MFFAYFGQIFGMEIQILQLLDGAKKASGLTVIIDVFRAFSTACYIMDKGAAVIIPVGNINTAYHLKENNPGFILVGERNEKKPEGFDFGNSPFHLLIADLNGKTIVHTTSSGTQGIVNATGAGEIITGSFVNAGAIVKYIRKQKPEKVSLVCMGYACEYPTEEDTFCAEFIKNELEGIPNDINRMKEIIRKGDGARFFDPEKQSWSPQPDFELCLDLNRFDFVLKVERETKPRPTSTQGEGILFLKKVNV